MQEKEAVPGEQLGAFIRDQRRGLRLSLRRLSELSGISNPYLSQIERGLRKPSAEVLQQIARALVVPTEQLYVLAGILEPTEDGDLVAHIRRDLALTEEQKDALERMYRGFREAAEGPGGEHTASG